MRRYFYALFLLSLSVFLLQHTVSAQQTTMAQRIEQYKKETAASMTGPEQVVVASRCKTAQTLIKNYHDRALRVRVTRGQLYNQQIAKLSTLIEASKKKGKNVKTLESVLTQLDSNIEAYKAKQSNFIEVLLDAQNIDCSKDPLGFKASVIMVQKNQKLLVESSQNIKQFVNSTLQSALKDFGGPK